MFDPHNPHDLARVSWVGYGLRKPRVTPRNGGDDLDHDPFA